jgi:hypothetical protein
MPYASTTGERYHDRRRCRRLHATGGRIRAVDAGDREPCPHCVDDTEPDTCEVVKTDGEVCGRDRPCPYHD